MSSETWRAFACIALSLVLISASAASAQEHPQPRRPNIVYILVDDMGYGDPSCYGQTHFRTPNIDRLAAEGLRFTQHYAGDTVCAPSRACLMTGLHTGHVYMRGNGPYSLRPDPDDIVLPRLLKPAGYATALIGKSGLSCNSDDGGFVNAKGFDYFFGFTSHGAAHNHFPKQLWRDGERVKFPDNKGHEGKNFDNAMFADEAVRYIDEHKSGSPFFLHLALTLPHPDLYAPPDVREQFVGKFDEPANPRSGGYRHEPKPVATYAAMCVYADQIVGRVIDTLKTDGLADHTLVIFASDNGSNHEGGYDFHYLNSNDRLRGGKRDMYEGGIRIPMIAWWPGTIRTGVTDLISAFWDFVPTACDLAGVRPPDNLDGISFAPTLLGHPEQQKKHEFLYWEFYEEGGKQAVRMDNWKLVKLNVDPQLNGTIELYDLSTDPSESKDLAAAHPDVVAKLDAIGHREHAPSPLFVFGQEKRSGGGGGGGGRKASTQPAAKSNDD